MKHGKGNFKWADGSKFDGEFRNNEINGYGKFIVLKVSKGSMSGRTEGNTKEHGWIIKWKGKGFSHGLMGENMMGIIMMIKNTDMEFLNGNKIF